MAKAWFAVVGALFASALASEQQILSQGPHGTLRRFNISSQGQRESILKLAKNYDLDVWHIGQSNVDVYSPPNAFQFPQDLQGLPHTTSSVPVTPSRPDCIESLKDWNLSSLTNSTFHHQYHSVKQINRFLLELVDLHPNTTSLAKIGMSPQGRDILALTIAKPPLSAALEPGKKKKKKKVPHAQDKLDFVILGAQHAREWIATATSLYLAHALTVNVSSSEPHALNNLLDAFNFHIIPVPNPDGYRYTWTTDRYWYKTRQIVAPHSRCYGVDMNRNWGYKWDGGEVESPAEPADPCSHWYPGSRPFESPEVNSIANFVSTLHNPVAFIDLRSYGQMISTPYSYSCKRQPKDGEDQAESAFGAAHAMKEVHESHFEEGRLCENLYEAPGNVIDWMYQRAYIKYSYVVHLRDTGTYGFSLPEKWIRPVGEETSSMIQFLAKFITGRLRRKF